MAVSGPVDLVVGTGRSVRVANGDPLLTKVTGGGCALGAVMAAYAALADDRVATTAAAVAYYTVAAELAAEQSGGPGRSRWPSWMHWPRSPRRRSRTGRGSMSADLSIYLVTDTSQAAAAGPLLTWSRPPWRAG